MQWAVKIGIITTYYFANLCNMNSGIATAIFTTSLVSTFIIFYFKYDEKVTKAELIGSAMIGLCVILISVGGAM